MLETIPPAVQQPLRAELRAATAAVHNCLDQALGQGSRLATPAGYAAFLQASLAVVEPLERGLARWLPAHAGAARTASLRADLAVLGAVPAGGPALPLPASLAQARGAAYVLEGSRLGGKLLVRLLAPRLAPLAGCFAYLAGGPADPSSSWRDFLDELDQWGAQAGAAARASACAAALATFAAYADAFASVGLVAAP